MGHDLDALLAKVPCWQGKELSATPLGGGITNENFRVDANGESFVLRVLSKTTEHLGINRDNECACTRIAAELGIGPEVVCFAPEDSLLVVRFVEAKPLSLEAAREPETMARIVAAIRRYHDGPDFPGEFCPFDTVRNYHRSATEHGVDFPPSVGGALECMARIENAVARVRTRRPCHNDLLAANFLDDGSRISIIDWEYGGMGDPFFDLGNFSVNQELDDAGARYLLECYRGEVQPRDMAHLKLMELASDLREAFWGFLQSGVSQLEFDYVAYGGKHLERFLARASAPELDRWLRDLA